MSETADKIVKRLAALKTLRRPHEQVWRECFDFTYPLRGSGFSSEVLDAQQGQSKRANLLDATATDAVRILASAIMSGLTPANSRWFQLDVGQESEDERRWLDMAAQTLWENIHMANFDAAAFEAVLDVVCAGWFALYIEEDPDEGGLRFHQWPLSGVYASTTDPCDGVDTVYRCFTLTAEQAVAEFGEQEEGSEGGKSFGVSEKTAKLAKEKPDENIEFVHAIYPRKTKVDNPRLARNLPVASVHVEVKEKRIVRESGYHEMPVVVPRWMLIPDSVYGIGPVFDSLPDVKMLNELKRMELASADLAIAGMWIAEDDGVLNPRTVKVGPRKIIVANSVDSMKPLQTGANFELSEVLSDQLQKSIRKVLMADQLQPQDGPAMTATEVHVRVNLIRQLLGPIYGRLQAEYLQPLIERCFGLAYRAGVFGPSPDTLSGREFSVRYLSPLARAQKLEDVTAIERLHVNVAQIAQVKPEVLDLIDEDATVRILSDALGVPTKVVRKTADVQQLRQDRAQQQQAAAQQAQAAQIQQAAGEAMVKKAVGGAA